MNRNEMLSRLRDEIGVWDVVIVGGGATGVGIAIDAVTRGYSTLLVEQSDFGKGTSSRSTKLVHGGVRYLQQGNIKLVTEALYERSLLLKNAPHVARDLSFILPAYKWWEKPFYGLGLKVYDALAIGHGIGRSKVLSRQATLQQVPTLESNGLRGSVLYHDGQFDDTRLLIHMARTAAEQGAVLLNYAPCVRLIKNSAGHVEGIVAHVHETEEEFQIKAKIVINATGVFADHVRQLDDPAIHKMVQPSQGIHLVLDREFLPGTSAIIVPRTDDGRVLFAIPWHSHTVIGTTDTPVKDALFEPRALEEEIGFVLKHAREYLSKDPTDSDVRSVYAGLRPLVSLKGHAKTAVISRDHTIVIERSGMLTITGGKWTTYRRMAQDAVDRAAEVAGLPKRPCQTVHLRLHGAQDGPPVSSDFCPHGSDLPEVDALCRSQPGWNDPIHPRLSYRLGEVVWAARNEMARTVEDVLARRTRTLFLDAEAAVHSAPKVAQLLASEFSRDESWQRAQIEGFAAIASGYLLSSYRHHEK